MNPKSDPHLSVKIRVCPSCGGKYEPAQNERCPIDQSATVLLSESALIDKVVNQRYRIRRLIGVGAWSEVYEALDEQSKATVAIKILHTHLANDPLKVARFQREATLLMRLKHPNIALIFETAVVEDGDRPCLIMEYLFGMSLDSYLRTVGRLSVPQCIELFAPVCKALSFAHKKNMVHRDLKPSNIFLVEKNNLIEPRILDFGLAKLDLSEEGGALASLTQDGEILGTPAYMSPEQCIGGSLDLRSDLYALGCVLYECLTNKRAVPGKNAFEAMSNQISRIPDAIFEICPEAKVPEALEDAIFKLLDKDPENRFQDADSFLSALLTTSKSETSNRDGKKAKAQAGSTISTSVLG